MLSHGQEADNFTWSVFAITREKYGETIGTAVKNVEASTEILKKLMTSASPKTLS